MRITTLQCLHIVYGFSTQDPQIYSQPYRRKSNIFQHRKEGSEAMFGIFIDKHYIHN